VTVFERTRPLDPAALAVKVPPVTALFWIIKVLTTGMGETASDFLARTIAPEVAVGAAGLVLAGALVVQMRARAYSTGLYWLRRDDAPQAVEVG